MNNCVERQPSSGEVSGGLWPIGMVVAAVIDAAARAPLPIPPRLWVLAREMRASACLVPISDFAAVRLVHGAMP